MTENEKHFYNRLDEEFQPAHEQNEDGSYYTESDYEELQRNLVLYKQGNREATNYIIKVFHPFITKYTRFIINGDLPYYITTNKNGRQYKRVSQTISSFVSLFNDKEEGLDKKKQFSNTCLKIKTLFSKYEYFDIYNELVLALLNMANKYKVITDKNDPHYKKNGTFHMYVSKCFHWEAYRFLKKLVSDPLAHFEVYSLHDQFDDVDMDILEEGHDIILKDETTEKTYDDILNTVSRQNDIENSNKLTLKEDKNLSVYDIETLNFNWTNGVTCSPLFKDLSPYERELIILSFVEHKSSQEISEIYGCHRATINLHKNRAIEKIRQKAQKLGVSI